jgi:3-deoxy-D-manno-octulosonic-acid transferase
LIVPRHITRAAEVAALLDASGLNWQRRTQIDVEGLDPHARILLVDTIGELGGWWGAAHIAFVGGSLGNRGGQNMIEPAAYGAAVSFGPNTQNFRDIVSTLLENRAVVVVRNQSEMTEFVRHCIENSAWSSELGQRARRVVLSQQGAADRTMQCLVTLVRNAPTAARQSAA